MGERAWEQIETDYVEGTLSICAIARRHGLSEATIRKRAKSLGWQRRGRTPPALEGNRGDAAAEAGSADPEAIRGKHRRAVLRLNRLHDNLADKAAGLVEAAGSVRELADAAAAIERLGRIAERLIALERQVFGLDDVAAAEIGDGLAETLRKARERAGLPPV